MDEGDLSLAKEMIETLMGEDQEEDRILQNLLDQLVFMKCPHCKIELDVKQIRDDLNELTLDQLPTDFTINCLNNHFLTAHVLDIKFVIFKYRGDVLAIKEDGTLEED